MINGVLPVDGKTPVSQIVLKDYRAADVFKKFDISFCCGGNLPLTEMCRLKQIDAEVVISELNRTLLPPSFAGVLNYHEWSFDFLIDYIVNVHHNYLNKAMPVAEEYVLHFKTTHQKKFPYLSELNEAVITLHTELKAHINEKESIIFPYIKQISHAFAQHQSYAGLLVRTLKKPVENILHAEHNNLNRLMRKINLLTDNYTPPDKACLTHKVCFAKLREICQNLILQLYIENQILFPGAIAMEEKCLAQRPL
jgi:regulator of cell morphogenesis and NO signaling